MIRPLILCLCLLLAACASDLKDPYQGWSDEALYQEGHTLLKDENYSASIRAYESLQAQYPFNDYTKLGDLELIYAYYASDDHTLSALTAERYLKRYPEATHRDYALYMLGVVHFASGRTFIQRYFPYDMSKHDPEDFLHAYRDFFELTETYPDSPYYDDSRRRMFYLRDQLAQHQLNIAQYYYDIEAYVAAIARAQSVVLQFPHAPQSRTALNLLHETYRNLNLLDLAEQTQAIILLNDPSSTPNEPEHDNTDPT